MSRREELTILIAALLAIVAGSCRPARCPERPRISKKTHVGPRLSSVLAPIWRPDPAPIIKRLITKHGEGAATRIRRGVTQVCARWRPADGDAKKLLAFAEAHFVADDKALADTFARLQYGLEMIDGHAHTVRREVSRFAALDEGPRRPVDKLLAGYSPKAHIQADLFGSKLAFVALLNFPLSTLEQRLAGHGWSRQRWAEARLTARFEHRVPAAVRQRIAAADSAARAYIDNYNIHMHRLVDPAGKTPFPEGLKLISHWGLRDEIRAQYGRYSEGKASAAAALARQRLITTVMARIVRQEIPAAVIDNPALQWDPTRNRIRAGETQPWQDKPAREPDARYARLKQVFDALRSADAYYPHQPSHRQRVFDLEREMPEAKVRALLEATLSSPHAARVAALLSKRLGRKLEDFDIWLMPKDKQDSRKLDKLTRARYPDAKALQRDLPRLLGLIGFGRSTAAWLAKRIVVDPSRGAGHAYGIARRDDKAHLRTRVGKRGLDYKGYNIAIHELGHNVEQVLSMARVDHTLLNGVPNTAFTEAMAFHFQDRDLELLGLKHKDRSAAAMRTIGRFWTTFEIGGVAMLDIELWRWMYAHPKATLAELREAKVALAKQVWNRYFAPVLGGKRDSVLLAIYSHIIGYGLYTPDYPLGLLITYQIDEHLAAKRRRGPEIERICRLGRLAPDVWMKQAVGQPVSAQPLLVATDKALKSLGY